MVGPGIWGETLKNVKNDNVHCRTWNMARKLKNVENEHKHSMNYNMARNTEKLGK